jgi:hypothetical protein
MAAGKGATPTACLEKCQPLFSGAGRRLRRTLAAGVTIALELLGGVVLASALIAFALWRRAEGRIFAVVLVITAAY